MSYLLRISRYLTPYKFYLMVSVGLTLLFSIANMLTIPLIQHLVDKLADRNLMEFSIWAGYAFILFSIRLLSKVGQIYIMSWVGMQVGLNIRLQVFEKLTSFSLDFYVKSKIGDIMTRLFSDVDRIRETVVSNFEDVLPQGTTLIGVMGYLIYLNWRLAAISLVGFPIFILLTTSMADRFRRAYNQAQEKGSDILQVAQETITNIHLVKAFVREKREINRFYRNSRRQITASMRTVRYRAIQEPLISLLQFAIIIGVVWFGGFEVARGEMTGAQLLAFFTGVMLLIDPILALSRIYNLNQAGLASSVRIFELLDQTPSIINVPDAIHLDRINGGIGFEGVSFWYPTTAKDRPVISNVNLTVTPGETIALVGFSGAGKSTMVNLIPRFYDPQVGTVTIDGLDIKRLDLSTVRSQIAVVPQESFLFRGTILENIKYGKLDATEAEVIEAASQANAWEFISQFPSGLWTKIGDRGVRLSGGQRQRLSIARAILKNPRILILDEATSSLDSKSEYQVQEALYRLMSNRTTVVIAHRLSTIINANRIAVMDGGQIVDLGTHDELISRSGIYSELYKIQFARKREEPKYGDEV